MSWNTELPALGWLLLVLGLGTVVIAWWRPRLNWDPRRRRRALAVRLAWIVLGLLALLDPIWRRAVQPAWTTVLVEQGPVLGDAGVAAWEAWQERAGVRPAEVDVIRFGADPAAPADLRLAWAEAELRRPPGRVGPVLVVSSTHGPVPAPEQWQAARAAGRTVSWLGVDPAPLADAAVAAIRAPERLRPGEPFVWEVDLEASPDLPTAEVEVIRAGVREAARAVTFTGGRARLEIADRAGDEPFRRLDVTVRATGDQRPDNDHFALIRPVAAAGRIRWVTDRPDQAAPLVSALRAEGLLLEVMSADALPTTPQQLPPATVLVFDNIPAPAIPAAFQDGLGPWLRQGQGGLLVLGGDRSLGTGGYRDSVLGQWLPVEPRFERDEERPVVALVLAFDRSGSMAGEKLALAREAALAAAEALAPRDLIGVITFDSEARWLVEPTPALDRNRLQQRLATVTAGGGTAISPALALAEERLPSLAASRRHLILLTDGISQPGPMIEQVRRLAGAGVTVSTVGVGADTDRLLLDLLAREGGGRFYYTPDPRTMPQIFTRETERIAQTGFREEPFSVQPGRRALWLEAAVGGRAPQLRGVSLTLPRAGADIWLRTDQGDPLLASWRVGLGRAAVFTSDARARWAADWLAWERFGAFWAGVLRHVQPPGGGVVENLGMSATAVGWRVTWEPPAESLAGGRPVRLVLVGPDGAEHGHELVEVWPGRWEVEAEALVPGDWRAEVVIQAEDGSEQRRWAAAAQRRPPGAESRPADRQRLEAWAAAGGGVVDPATWLELPEPQRGEAGRVGVALGPWLWGLVLILFVVDLWWRRRPVRVQAMGARRRAQAEETAA